jgi:hypothetical protein
MGEAHLFFEENTMTDLGHVETLLQEAIALLTDSGFPLAADALRDNLRGIREAPTAGARRHRIFQLRDALDGTGAAGDVFFCSPREGVHGPRFSRTAVHRGDEERYRLTLLSIQEILAAARVA